MFWTFLEAFDDTILVSYMFDVPSAKSAAKSAAKFQLQKTGTLSSIRKTAHSLASGIFLVQESE